jgi:hypothetical protein
MRTRLIQMAAAGLMVFSGLIGSPGQNLHVLPTNLFPVADATIRSDAPDSNFGGATFVMAGSSNSGAIVSRGLFRFDLSGIPTNATVSNVTLTVVGVNLAMNEYFGLSRVLTNWNESEVTWNRRTASMPWTAPGGQTGTDIFSDVSSYLLIQAMPGVANQFTNGGFFPGDGMVSDAQRWINHPEQNFGWIWADFNEVSDNTLVEVGSRENPGSQAVLNIGYVLPFAPPVIQVVSSTNNEFCFKFNGEANYGYQVQRSGDLRGTNWVTVEVLDPLPKSQDLLFCFPMTTSNLFYRARYQ